MHVILQRMAASESSIIGSESSITVKAKKLTMLILWCIFVLHGTSVEPSSRLSFRFLQNYDWGIDNPFFQFLVSATIFRQHFFPHVSWFCVHINPTTTKIFGHLPNWFNVLLDYYNLIIWDTTPYDWWMFRCVLITTLRTMLLLMDHY